MRARWTASLAATGLLLMGVLAGSVGARQSALPAGNLVKNPGAEFPLGAKTPWGTPVKPAAWTVEGVGRDKGVQVVRYGTDPRLMDTALSKEIGGGRNYFHGGYPSSASMAFQTIDVSRAAADFRAGGVKACVSAYLGGSKNTSGSARLDLQFLNATESPLGRVRIPAVTRGARLDAGTMKLRKAEGKVPANTRHLLVTLTTASGGGPDNRGSADNISVVLTKGACPK